MSIFKQFKNKKILYINRLGNKLNHTCVVKVGRL